jgi:hypothetical protein
MLTPLLALKWQLDKTGRMVFQELVIIIAVYCSLSLRECKSKNKRKLMEHSANPVILDAFQSFKIPFVL